MSRHSASLLLLALVILMSGSGCTVLPDDRHTSDTLNESLTWPRPPAQARIRYVKSISSPADWGISKGFFENLLATFTGRSDIHFVRPTGVAERAGVLFVADPGARALFIFDTERHRVLKVDRLGQETLVSPVAVALGPADTVFLVDSWLKKIFAVDREGRLQRVVIQQGLGRPAAVAYDSDHERLYVADSMAHRILVYTREGEMLKAFGANGKQNGQFNSPTHLAISRDGDLLVTDGLNFRIQVFDSEGNFRQKIGIHGDGAGNLAAPKGLASDKLGQIYVVDTLFDAVQIFRNDGRLLLGFGERGTKAGQFWLPNGLYMSPQDVLYVADAYNQRIQVFQVMPVPAKEDKQ